MPAAYDTYDYPSYWINREYEHKAEVYALKSFLKKIPRINKLIEVGAGYGRLVPIYLARPKKIVISDPSSKLLSLSRRKFAKFKKVKHIHSSLSKLPDILKTKNFDLCIMVRVLHHIEDSQEAFKTINKILKPNGYFILEFANKRNIKSYLANLLKGNLMYPLETETVDLRSKKSIKLKTLPFLNYHPDKVIDQLNNAGFKIIEVRSVSNIRSKFMKRVFPLSFLVDIEKILQEILSRFFFGPSIFILSKKRIE